MPYSFVLLLAVKDAELPRPSFSASSLRSRRAASPPPPLTAVLDGWRGSDATSSPQRGPRPAEVPRPHAQVRGALSPRPGEPAEAGFPLPPASGRGGGLGKAGAAGRSGWAGGRPGLPAPWAGLWRSGAGRAGRRAVERSRSDDALPALPGGGLRLESAAAAAAGGGGAGGSGQQASGGEGSERAAGLRRFAMLQ